MKASRQRAAASRERIVDAASRLFRAHGLDGISVADVMGDAGLTHGGFYSHFESKDALMAEACARSLAESVHRWQVLCANAAGDPMTAVAASYLTMRHRDNPGAGCIVAALGTDVPRHAAPVRQAVTRGVRELVGVLAGALRGGTRATRRRRALANYASLVGALVLARAVDDPALSGEILGAVSASLAPTASARRR